MSDNTYSRTPFISYDGIDEHGVRAQVKVITGYGEVAQIEDSKNKKKSKTGEYGQKVHFEVSNTEWGVAGWSKNVDPVMKKVQEAEDNDEPIHFRVEIRRKNDVDRTASIDELSDTMEKARDNIHRSLAAVRLDSEEEWTISENAVTRLDEDPGEGGLNSAYNNSMEELQAARGGGSSSGQENAPQDWSRNLEAPPWVTWLDKAEGKLNLGSSAIAIPLSFYMYVTEYERENNLELQDKQRKMISRAMLSAANDIQVAIFDGELNKPDMSASSHVRARSTVFEVIRLLHPITADIVSSGNNLKTWKNDIVESGTDLLQWSVSEVKLFLK